MPERILVVDDSRLNLKILALVLGQEGFELLQATNGTAAIQLAREETPDLILLDLVMPDMDGYEVCGELKKDETTADIPIIFLSASSEDSSKVKALEIGASDFIPKSFSRDEVIARVNTQLRIRQLTKSLTTANHELRERQRQIEADLRAAGAIQGAMLPSESFQPVGASLRWAFLPCEGIGGDIFDVYPLTDDRLALFMLDVSGHGVSSALVAVSVAHTLSSGRRSEVGARPAEVLADLEEQYPQERFDKLLSLCYAVLDIGAGELLYSSAGHPPPLLLRADGGFEELSAGGPMIGTGVPLPFEEEVVPLSAGDRIVFYTDGITEHQSPAGELFGIERLCGLVQDSGGRRLDDLVAAVLQSLDDHGDGEAPRDDISLLAIDYTPR